MKVSRSQNILQAVYINFSTKVAKEAKERQSTGENSHFQWKEPHWIRGDKSANVAYFSKTKTKEKQKKTLRKHHHIERKESRKKIQRNIDRNEQNLDRCNNTERIREQRRT